MCNPEIEAIEKRMNQHIESLKIINDYELWSKNNIKYSRITFLSFIISFVIIYCSNDNDNYIPLMSLNLVIYIYILIDMRESRKRKETFNRKIKEVWNE